MVSYRSVTYGQKIEYFSEGMELGGNFMEILRVRPSGIESFSESRGTVPNQKRPAGFFCSVGRPPGLPSCVPIVADNV